MTSVVFAPSLKRWAVCGARHSRLLGLWSLSEAPEYRSHEQLVPPVTFNPLPDEVTHLSHGVNFSLGYKPLLSSCVWLFKSGKPRPHQRSKVVLPPSSGSVKQVSAGREHASVLTTDGQVFLLTLGSKWDEKGVSDDSGPISLVKLDKIPKMSKVCCGLDHTLMLTEEGKVFAHGWSADGQTGLGHDHSTSCPTELKGEISDRNVSSVHTCADSSFAMTKSGQLYAWGNNEYGQLAAFTGEKQIFVPTQVDVSQLKGSVLMSIACGGSFTVFLTGDGAVQYCGYGLGPELSYAVDPSKLCKMRRLAGHEGGVSSVHSSLHYLLMLPVSGSSTHTVESEGEGRGGGGGGGGGRGGQEAWLWGSLPAKRVAPSTCGYSAPHKFFLPWPKDLVDLQCGCTEVTATYHTYKS